MGNAPRRTDGAVRISDDQRLASSTGRELFVSLAFKVFLIGDLVAVQVPLSQVKKARARTQHA